MLCTCSPFVASSFIPLFLTHEIVDWWKTTGVCERLMLLRGNQGLCEELLCAAESTIQPGACRCLSSSPSRTGVWQFSVSLQGAAPCSDC